MRKLGFEIRPAIGPLTGRWRDLPVEPRGTTALGISFRPIQAEALGLDPQTTLRTLLSYGFPLIRLGAYWNRIEPEPDAFDAHELDAQVDAAEQARKHIILCVGAVKTFGYPEVFVPAHHLQASLQEGALVTPDTHPQLLDAAIAFIDRIVERYQRREAIVAWQVEHEAVDPLGFEHSWRLAAAFVKREVETVRQADPSRPIMLNGYLPTSFLERVPQWWRTRDQGDSLAVAGQFADVVGIDYYPCHALLGIGPWSAYLSSTRNIWQGGAGRRLRNWAQTHRGRLMIAEGQAEPWERVTVPPNPPSRAMYSCPPEQLIRNYNGIVATTRSARIALKAYLFWGAEYWVLREQSGDSSYLGAFARVLE